MTKIWPKQGPLALSVIVSVCVNNIFKESVTNTPTPLGPRTYFMTSFMNAPSKDSRFLTNATQRSINKWCNKNLTQNWPPFCLAPIPRKLNNSWMAGNGECNSQAPSSSVTVEWILELHLHTASKSCMTSFMNVPLNDFGFWTITNQTN